MPDKTKSRKVRYDHRAHPVKHRILLPINSLTEADILLPLANAIAREKNSDLIVMNIVIVPKTGRLSQGAIAVSRLRQALNHYLSEHAFNDPHVHPLVRAAHDFWDSIWETVEQEEIDMLVLGWAGNGLDTVATHHLEHPRLATPPCDLVIIRPSSDFDAQTGWQNMKRILLPVRGGPNAVLALRIAHSLAELTGNGQITLLHATKEAPREAEQQLLTNFGTALRGLNRLTRSLTVVGDIKDTIIEEAVYHQAVVMGSPTRPSKSTGWRNEALETIEREITRSLIIVKERSPQPTYTEAQIESLTLRRDRPLAAVVDKWFAENTFHSREFAEIEDLVRLKELLGVTISLGLPALNEEATVGNVIQTVKSVLMDELPLLDEIVLIDSGSTDYTREIATDLDIPVYIHQDILRSQGAYKGKGEALWKSQFVLKGDIIAWIDTDIKNIHPRFVYGIIGPLLRNAQIQYVKGFYRRPLRQGDKLVAGSGGRVTELTARPLINLFYPELSGIIQPLSGEYAGRRQALEKLPFFTGYGVETGLLLDILDDFGLQAVAQVDLLERIHHNQPLPSLSKMSFTIIQVFMKRLSKRHSIRLLEDANLTINLPRYTPNRFFLETEELQERERPPMISIPEYRDLRGLEPLSEQVEPVQVEVNR
jgi:glycosyltransferase involved in cell wall biosynthesis